MTCNTYTNVGMVCMVVMIVSLFSVVVAALAGAYTAANILVVIMTGSVCVLALASIFHYWKGCPKYSV